MGPKHLTLNLDGKVAQPAFLTLPVQVVQNGGTDAGKTHLDGQRGRSHGVAASRVHDDAETTNMKQIYLSDIDLNYLA